MRHNLETAVYVQGWLESQFESMLAIQTDDANKQVAEQIAEMWKTVSETMDDLILENQTLNRRLLKVQQALLTE